MTLNKTPTLMPALPSADVSSLGGAQMHERDQKGRGGGTKRAKGQRGKGEHRLATAGFRLLPAGFCIFAVQMCKVAYTEAKGQRGGPALDPLAPRPLCPFGLNRARVTARGTVYEGDHEKNQAG